MFNHHPSSANLGRLFALALSASTVAAARAVQPKEVADFVAQHCVDCQDATEKKGGLNLDELEFRMESPAARAVWAEVFDRVQAGEVPPKKKVRSINAWRSISFFQMLQRMGMERASFGSSPKHGRAGP